jgi:hypothetical protein
VFLTVGYLQRPSRAALLIFRQNVQSLKALRWTKKDFVESES